MKHKPTVVAIILIILFAGSLLAYGGKEIVLAVPKEKKKEEPIKWCPTTLISDNDKCMTCHVVSGGKFVLKATRPDAHLDYPTDAKILNYGTDNEIGYYLMDSIIPSAIQTIFWFFEQYGINHVIIEIYSYGGGLFGAWRTKGLFDEWKAKGGILETRIYGGAMSAGFMLFCAGTKGYRFVQPQAELMWHELQAGQWPEVTSPSKEEHKAEIYRHLQDTANEWLATRGKMTKEELDEKVAWKEFWFTGKEAVELGFADGFIK